MVWAGVGWYEWWYLVVYVYVEAEERIGSGCEAGGGPLNDATVYSARCALLPPVQHNPGHNPLPSLPVPPSLGCLFLFYLKYKQMFIYLLNSMQIDYTT